MKHHLIFTVFFLVFSIHVIGNDKEIIDSLHIALNNSKGNERVNLLNRLSTLYRAYETDQVGHLSKVAIDVAHEEGFREGEAIAYENLAWYFSKKNIGDSAVFSYLKALNYYEGTNKLDETASIYNSLGISLMNTGRYSESLDYLVKGLMLRQELGDKSKIGGSYCNMGIVMEFLHEPEQALEYYVKSHEHIKLGDNKGSLSSVLMNIGVVNFTLGNFRQSNKYYSEALVIQLQNDDQYGLMKIYRNLGNLSMEIKDLSAAIVYYNMSLDIATKLGDINSISGTYIKLGDLYGNKMVMFEKGLEYLEKGLVLAKSIGNKWCENEAYKSMAESYSANEEFEKAYILEKRYANLNDSLVRTNAKLQIEKSKAVLQIQKDRLKTNSKKIAEADVTKETSYNRMCIVVGVSAFLVLVFLGLYLKGRRHL